MKEKIYGNCNKRGFCLEPHEYVGTFGVLSYLIRQASLAPNLRAHDRSLVFSNKAFHLSGYRLDLIVGQVWPYDIERFVSSQCVHLLSVGAVLHTKLS